MADEPNGDDVVRRLRVRVDPALDRIVARSGELGFLGSMPIAEQVDHALGYVAIVDARLGRRPESVLDLGTGGGVPGLVLISCWPGTRVVLLDASERRTDFLREVIDGWPPASQVEVVRERAEQAGHHPGLREQFEVVTSRSFGSPASTAECGAPFLAVGGFLVVSEPPPDESADRWPGTGLAQVGLAPLDTVRLGGRYGYQILTKTSPIGDRYPRRVGVPVKRPIF